MNNSATNSKKKLLFTILSLGGGGAERVLVHLMNCLDKDKYDIYLVLFENIPDYQKELDSSVNYICLNKKNRSDIVRLILSLRKVLCDVKPDVVMSFTSYINIITVIASIIAGKRFKLIISERNHPRKYLPEFRVTWLRKWLMKLTYQRANHVISVSRNIENVLKEDFNILPSKIKTIYNPLVFDNIKIKSQEKIEHPFFKNKNSRVIMSIGRLAKQKRFDRLLRAFSVIKEKHENLFLIILGKGELIKELQDLALELNINRYVDFVGFQANPYAWLSNADIFVLSSDYEGFPNVLIEAMACGIPVVSTDCPSGPNEIVNNGKNGILVPTQDENAMADAIDVLLYDESLRKELSDEGRKRVEDFRIEKIFLQYEELF